MASIFLQDPIYITVQQVKDSTSKSWLASESDDNISILIYKAEKQIDNYLQCAIYKKFVSTQELFFPVLDPEDDSSLLPSDITEACLYVVEQLYINWDTISAWNGWAIKKEVMWPHTVEYVTESEIDSIPNDAQLLLDNWKNIFIYNNV